MHSPNDTIAVLVGVETYAAGDSWALDGPVAEVRELAWWLRSRGVPAENIHAFVTAGTSTTEFPGHVHKAHREEVRRVLMTTVAHSTCSLLWFHWSGHGVVDQDYGRRLFYADASATDKQNIDFDDLLKVLRTSFFPHTQRTIACVDACATASSDLRAPSSLPHETLPRGAHRHGREQFVLFAARPGAIASTTPEEKKSFSAALLQTLRTTTSWPPDMMAVKADLWGAFTSTGRQAPPGPTYLWTQDWSDGQELWHDTAPSAGLTGSVIPINNLPPSARLVGRESELSQLIQRSAPRDGMRLPVQIIHGMPGVGKTALAVELADRLTGRHPDAQLYIDMYGYTMGRSWLDPSEALGTLLLLIGIPSAEIPDRLRDRSNMWRREMSRRRAVIVIDNARTSEHVEPLLVSGPHVICVVTSRSRLTALAAADYSYLDCLSEKNSVALLSRMIGTNRERADISSFSAIVKAAGGLPLALHLVGGQLRRRPALTLSTYAARLTGPQGSSFPDSTSSGIQIVFDLSYDALSPFARTLYRTLGEHPGPAFEVHLAAALLDQPLDRAAATLEELFDNHLLEEREEGRFYIHDLVRQHAAGVSGTQESELEALHERLNSYWVIHTERAARVSGTRSLLEPTHERRTMPDDRDLPLHDAPAAVAWFEREWENIQAVVKKMATLGDHHEIIRIAAALAGHLRDRGLYDEAVDMHHLSLKSSKAVFDDSAHSISLENLGVSHLRGGAFDRAISHLDQACAAWEAVNDLPNLARCLDRRGFTYERLGHYDHALRDMKQAREYYRQLGDDHGIAQTLSDIGAVRWRQQRYEQALESFTKALALRRDLGDRSGQATTLNNLGLTYQRLSDWQRAEACLRQAEEMATETSDRDLLTIIYNNFGYLWASAGEPLAAIRAARQGFALATMLGSRYQKARSLDAMARSCAAAGHYSWAERIGTEAMDMFRQLNVPEAEELRTFLASSSRRAN
ncbi:tetratricopeptide repeat protein [Streptomyces sp. CRN 30]|uniref:tetratricopeptide repeat protein n=1 Tax=Streptomyces sp. CRN 30 TaxID=3075613 RepID=UPI002A82082F|nr:tetratricopeptide repeat protein [Streptomyces sp. CRN 30]